MMDWSALGLLGLFTIVFFKLSDLRTEVDELKLEVRALEKREEMRAAGAYLEDLNEPDSR